MDTYDQLKANVEAVRASVENLYRIQGALDLTRSDIDFLDREGASGLELSDFYDEDELADGIDEDTPISYGSATLADMAHDMLAEYPLSIEGVWKGSSKEDADLSTVIVTYCTGGPHVGLDTTRRQFIGHWGGETVYRMADSDLCAYYEDMLDV